MAEIINLRRVRKRAAKQREDERAALNRMAHGRSKAQRTLEAVRSDKSSRELDAHKLDTGEGR